MRRLIILMLFITYSFFGATAQDWMQIGNNIPGERSTDESGRSVSLSSDGNTVAIGALLNDNAGGSNSGHVRVYDWSGIAWLQRGSDIDGEAADDQSGVSVSLSSDGNTVAIGASLNDGKSGVPNDNRGHVRVYDWNGTTMMWEQRGSDIDGETAGDRSGFSVSLSSDGNTVGIGASFNDGSSVSSNDNRGHVRIYDWNGTTMIWDQRGSDIDGEAADDRSGFSVSLSSDGNTVGIGAINNDDNGSNSGQVRVYDWNGTTMIWDQRGSDIDGEAADDESGNFVSLSSSGNTVAIGAHFNDGNGSNSGQVRIFDWNGTTWQQRGSDIDGEAADDESGNCVSLSSSGNTVAIGAHLNDGNGSNSGQLRVFDWNGITWQQRGSDIDGEEISDLSGESVSLSSDGNRVAMGAFLNDDNGTRSGHVRVYELVSILICPVDTAVSCTSPTDTETLGIPNGLILGSSDTLSLENDSLDFNIGCENDTIGRILRSFVSINKDSGERDTICVQKITVIDTIAPVIICPADTTLDCTASTDTMFNGVATATDDCGLDTIRYEDTVVDGACANEDTTFRLWIAVDNCGNMDSCTQIITRVDTIPPEIAAELEDTLRFDCRDEFVIELLYNIFTNCGTATIDTVYEVTDSVCVNDLTIHTHIIATDSCGNADTVTQVAIILDNLSPEIDVCPRDTMVNYLAPIDTTLLGTPVSFDNCGSIIITFRDDSTGFTGACVEGVVGSIHRTFFVVDQCGNVDSSCIQTIDVIDTLPPVITCPVDATLDCSANTEPLLSGMATASDNYGLDTIRYEDTVVEGTCANADTTFRLWIAVDNCGHMDSCTQVIIRIDTEAPAIVCPPDMTISCTASTDTMFTGIATATDNCGLAGITFEDEVVEGTCANNDTIFRSWVAIDNCGNFSGCTQVIIRIDATPPVIICPADTILDCTASTDTMFTGMATATDDCGLDTIRYEDTVVDGACVNEDTTFRLWIAVDNCGNMDSCTQIITRVDTIAPVIPMVNNVDTVNCGDIFDIVVPAGAQDNCDGLVLVESNFSIRDSICPGTYNIVLQFTATDSCGNRSEIFDTIVVQDTAAPVIDVCPADTIIECGDSTDTAKTGLPLVTDACDTLPTITFRDDSTGFAGICEDNILGTITRTFFITDACGNVDSSCLQTITIIDTLPPVVLSSPGDTIIGCDETVPVLDSSVVVVTDNCSDSLTFLPASSIVPGSCANSFVISQSLQILDRCGNDTTVSRTVTVMDTIPPQLVNCPPVTFINCEAEDSLPINTPEYTDNCSPSDSIVVTFEIDSVGFETFITDDDTIFIHYFAEDQCGNVDSSCTQVVLCRFECPTINCHGIVNVGLGSGCSVEITPDMILNQPLIPAFEPYCKITVEDEFGHILPDNIISGSEALGHNFTVTIRCDIPGCGTQECQTMVVVNEGSPLVFISAWQYGGNSIINTRRKSITGRNISEGKINVYCGSIPDPSEHIPMVTDPCSGKMYTPEVQPDWVMPIPCDEVNDTAEIILRTWEAYDKEGNLYTLTDTIVVFRLPKLTPEAFVGTNEDSFYCELEAVSARGGQALKRYASWKQPVGLHDYELPYTKLRGVTYEIPATIILAGYLNAQAQGPDVLAEYLKCVILRKENGTEVTIGDIVSRKYMNELRTNATQQQLGYGFLHLIYELNEKTLNVIIEAGLNFYPYLLLQPGDWILSEGGNFEQVDEEWFYNGNGNPENNGAGSPYWFSGGWPSIYGSGDCISYCDTGSDKGFGCIKVKIPKLNAQTGFDPQLCDTICLSRHLAETRSPMGTHCGIAIKQDPGRWQAPACHKIRGIDTWITQTCWAVTPNFCAEDSEIPCDELSADENEEDAVADYSCTDKAVKIHLSQWQTLFDTIGPIFDFCYPSDWDQEEIQENIRSGKAYLDTEGWERDYPTTYRVGTHGCAAEVYVPSVRVIDNCSGVHQVKAMVEVPGGTRAVALERTATETKVLDNGDTCQIYTYSHTADPITIPFNGCKGEPMEVRYEAADECWNQSTWSKFIRITDDVPPTVVADREVTVPLQNKIAWVHAETFDEGSWDNCSIDLRLARRTDWWADTECVDLCDSAGTHAPYDNWVDLLDDLGVDRSQATTAVGGGTVGESTFNSKYKVEDLKTVLNKGEVEDYYYNQIVWLWEDSKLCGQKVVHGWLYAIAANIAENCSATDEHGNVLKVKDLEEIFDHLTGTPGYGKEMALLGGGWSKSVPFKCEDACHSTHSTSSGTTGSGTEGVTVELIVFDYCCNWGKGWSTAHVEDKGNAKLVKRLPDLDISCEAYNSFYKDIVEHAAALGENGSTADSSGVFALLDVALGHYVKTWVDNQNRPTDIDGKLLADSVLNFGYHSISCTEKSATEKIAVKRHDGTIEWVNQVTKTTYLDTTNLTGMNGIVGINCAANCVQDVWVDLDECGQGTITRRFTIKGGCGPDAPTWEVEQVINVASACGLRESMFDLPQNVGSKDAPICLPQALSDAYMPDTIGAVTVKPHLEGVLCNSIAIGTDIQEFDIPMVETQDPVSQNPNIKKYVITWSVIDWCADHTSTTREFTYTQEVIATIDPNCTVSQDTSGAVSSISGHVMTELNSAVNGVEVKAVLGKGSPLNVETPESGVFNFTISNGSQVSIVPRKNTGFSNGISTADLIDIQRHVLQKKALDSKYQRIAADVNGNGRIDGLDVLELRQLVLNPSRVFASNTSWRFYETTTDKEVYQIDPVTEDQTVNFTAVKIGDVNLSGDSARGRTRPARRSLSGGPRAEPKGVEVSRSTDGQLHLNIADKVLKGGEVYRVEVRSDNFEDIRGLQYTMNYADAYVSIESIEPGVLNVTPDNYLKYAPGVLTLSWNESEGVNAGPGQVLFTIVVKALNGSKLRDILSLNNLVTKTEAYSDNGDLKTIALRFDGSKPGFALYQNTPNPYTGETVIGFKLPYKSAATMTIYDVTGRVIKTIQGDYQEGYNEVRVTSTELGTTGVLYYQLDTDRYTATKKMIVIE